MYLPVLNIEAPRAESPLGDPLQYIASDSVPFHGRFLYVAEQTVHDFVMRGIGIMGQVGAATSSVAAPRTEAAGGRIFGPLFSEDGKRILFKIGDPFESHGRYQLLLWDMAAFSLRPQEQAAHRHQVWRSGSHALDA